MNDLLRRALSEAQLTEADLAERLGVDPKTVHRWLAGRVPYPRHRARVAQLFSADETDLWPLASRPRALPEPPSAEIITAYPHRWAVPRHVWQRHFESAQHEVGILAYAGLFIAEDTGFLPALAEKACTGVVVRILLGNPDGLRIAERGTDEGVGDSLAAKIRNALILFRPLLGIQGVELRLHDTVLYNSIYRADDALLINPHAHGVPAAHAPVLQLRRAQDGDIGDTYLTSFTRVWTKAS